MGRAARSSVRSRRRAFRRRWTGDVVESVFLDLTRDAEPGDPTAEAQERPS
jgi:hypothetical protein